MPQREYIHHTIGHAMNRTARTTASAAGAAALLAVGLTGPASAAPDNANTHLSPVSCSDGTEYLLAGISRANWWSAQHDVRTGATLVPTYIRSTHTEIWTADGSTLLAEFDEEQSFPKGRGQESPAGQQDCLLTFSGIETIPDVGEVLLVVVGEMGFVPHS
jgi:hypothetical protein